MSLGVLAVTVVARCALDEPDENFYDHGLASNTIKQLQYAAQIYKKHQKPFFIQAGFARPHAPWRVPQRFWDMYNSSSIKLAKHKLPPTDMPGIAYQQDGCVLHNYPFLVRLPVGTFIL